MTSLASVPTLLFSRSRPGVYCIPSGCGHDAPASTVVHLFLYHAHSLGPGHTSKMYSNSIWRSTFKFGNTYSGLSSLCSVCRNGSSDDIRHRHVSHSDAPGRQAGAFPPPLLPHLLLLAASHGHWGQYGGLYLHLLFIMPVWLCVAADTFLDDLL